ncbi:MAG: DUF4292 domain-containing protein [Deltaproteobacteria bacterium]|nr:DUF4292 domain-containing protein [Deltaproteobacteria bacterium]
MSESEWSVVSGQWSARSKKNSLRLTSHVVLFTVFAVYLAGCAVRHEVRPSKALPITADEIISILEEGREKVHSLRGMASVKAVYNGKKTNVKEIVVAKRPSKIRAETVGLFGSPVLILAIDGSLLSIYKPAESVFYKGNVSSHDVSLPFPLNLVGTEELTNILLGGTSLIKYGNSDVEFSESENAYILNLRSPDGFKRQMISVDAKTLRLMKSEIMDGERGVAASVTFSNYQDVGNVPFPKEIKVQFLNKPDTLYISYEDIELNVEAADEFFVLTPPENSNRQ